MTDAEFEEQKARVECYIEKWRGPLGLWAWTIHWDWHRGPYADGASDIVADREASCESDWRYLVATIRFDLSVIKRFDDELVESTVIHEFMHMILNEMRGDTEDDHAHEERVATTLAQAFQAVGRRP